MHQIMFGCFVVVAVVGGGGGGGGGGGVSCSLSVISLPRQGSGSFTQSSWAWVGFAFIGFRVWVQVCRSKA